MFEILGEVAGAAMGGGIGAVIRLIPALFTGVGKMLTAKGDRDHEYRMLELQGKLAKDQGEQKLREMDTAGSWDAMSKQMDAWKSAIEAQGRKTGVAWVDAASAFVRPGVTYYFMLMYAGSKIAVAIWPQLAPVWTTLGTPADTQMFFGILGFWFVDRQLGKSAK